ncbi:carboxymuconolactone decarboxylase family protein [Mycobacterium sp. 1245805.9]|uniref:carboxymuconolactone decarboxylase family protein n=1 Tax=Mycobacterium sp. 1245805.9 TaxID=1856862 RepID=UPI0008001424|nr:carboxymuconolactone decarboxylase family protein [Mycobacterium sp. 1245805.9]OBI81189.1 carboxymuconolactone decarboxylase [Mycobacterium sp. 1245805.9]
MVTEIVTPRIGALEPPHEPAVAAQLDKMMPPGVPPIALFRTVVRNLPMAEAMTLWGGYELSRALSLSLRDREIVIDRTCARCGCEYEWGVHISFFAQKARLERGQVRSLTHGSADDPCWVAERDRLLIRAVDALCDHRDIDDALWAALRDEFDEREILDLTMLCGWYHAISFTARAARVPLEAGSPTFAGVA